MTQRLNIQQLHIAIRFGGFNSRRLIVMVERVDLSTSFNK
jgi:hypothetical protein